MMKELFLLKLGEIVLKGQNRRVFEDKLKTNTRRRMSKFGQFRVTITQSTLYVEPLNDECDVDGAWEACGAIFGIALDVPLPRLRKGPRRHFQNRLSNISATSCPWQKSFKVESKRSDKRFPLNSIQISQEIGGRIWPRNSRTSRSMSITRIVHRQHRGPRDGGLCPRPGGARRGRSAHRHGRARGGAAVGRHRFSGRGLYDRQARRGDRVHPLLLLSLHLRAGKGKGAGAGAHHDAATAAA